MSSTAMDFAILESFIRGAAKNGVPESEWKLALQSLRILAQQRGTDIRLARFRGLEEAAKIVLQNAESDEGFRLAAKIREAARRPS